MFKWIKNLFAPASASFTKPEVNPQITDSVTVKPKRAPTKGKKPTTRSPANKKAK
jgi:hypothetical protein